MPHQKKHANIVLAVVSPDGVCGLCYEHSASEGIVPVQILQDIIKVTLKITLFYYVFSFTLNTMGRIL